jgi:hypothetical protein
LGSWETLTQAMATGAPPVPAYAIDTAESRISPRRQLTDGEWDELIAVMKERKIAALDAGGLMTDAVLARVATLDHVTALSLGGSRQLTTTGCCTWPTCRSCSISTWMSTRADG